MARTTGNAKDLITFTRASTGTFLGSNGLLQTAAINTPRVEYDANGVAKGLLIEEQRTNLVTYSQDFNGLQWQLLNAGAGAVPVLTPNYATSPDGTNNAYRLQASVSDTSADYSVLQQNVSASGASVSSIWVKSNTGVAQDFYYRAEGSDQSSTFQATTEWQRFTLPFTVTGSVYFTIGARGTANGTSAVDILIYGPQLETGSFPTSYIPTSGATATRSADIASVSVSEFGYNQAQGSVVVEADYADQTPASSLVRIINGLNHYFLYISGGAWRFQVRSGTTVAQLTAPARNSNDTIAAAWSVDDYVIVDGSGIDADTSGALPDTSGAVLYFSGNGGYYGAGHIKSINYYPLRLSDAKLQELTS